MKKRKRRVSAYAEHPNKKVSLNKNDARHKVIMALLILLGVLCFLYFCMLVTYVGPQSFFFVFPLIGIACILLAAVWHGHYKGKFVLPRKLIVAFWTMVSLGIVLFGVLFGMILHGQSVGPEENADYLIVLGAGLRGERPSVVLRNRINAAAEYLLENPGSKVVVSGGQGSDELISEAEAMRRGLVELGIEETRIFMEDQSTSTNENLTFSKAYISDEASVVIVTNKFHVYRACHLARECGYTSVSGLGAENVRWLNPTNYLRECMAVFKDVVLR